MFICNGILFNHESPRRGVEFVTRKITKGMADIFRGRRTEPIAIGNLDSKRDWGYAKDYVVAMWKMLQHETPDDWVVATGDVHSVRDVVEYASKHIGVPISWTMNSNGTESAVDATGRIWVTQSAEFMRPNDVTYLRGDASKIKQDLGWEPTVSFEELIREMIDSDLSA
jgi:GDPmannose 4,6-dehydratase